MQRLLAWLIRHWALSAAALLIGCGALGYSLAAPAPPREIRIASGTDPDSAYTRAAEAYGVPEVLERHRHRFELNNEFRDMLQKGGLVFSGLSPDGRLVEISEVLDHPWMVGSQFHPEFQSRPNRPHPLFAGLIRAAIQHRNAKG